MKVQNLIESLCILYLDLFAVKLDVLMYYY